VKANTHPDYNDIKVTCSCGDSFVTKSTLKDDLSIDFVDKKTTLHNGMLHIFLKKHFQVVMLATLKKFLCFFKKTKLITRRIDQ